MDPVPLGHRTAIRPADCRRSRARHDVSVRRALCLAGAVLLAAGGARAEDVVARHDMVESADPRAAAIGRDILRAGGSAADAAVAMAISLTIVEPQSAGIGGGGFLLHFRARDKQLVALD